MAKLFPVYEVGSLPKLAARVKAFAADPVRPVSERDIAELIRWAQRAGIDYSPVQMVLFLQQREQRKLTADERQTLVDFNALLNLKLQEHTGMDFVYDGEARRVEMYQHIAQQIVGFEPAPEMIRSRGPDSWRASVCIAEPKLKSALDQLSIIREFQFAAARATAPLKVPIDDPYMVANMTLNRHYEERFAQQQEYADDPQRLRYEAKRALTLALAMNIIRPQVEAVVDAGAQWVQLDIPSATIDIPHIPIMVEGINAVVQGIDKVKFSLHLCYPRRKSLTDKSGYGVLFPHLLALDPRVDHLSLELANNDCYAEDLNPFAEYQAERRFEIGVGVVDITLERQRRGLIETPELVRDRLVTAAQVLGDAALVYAAPDCGLRQLSLERSVRLFEITAAGAELARRG